MVEFRRHNDRGEAMLVANFQIRLVLDQQLGDADVPLLNGK